MINTLNSLHYQINQYAGINNEIIDLPGLKIDFHGFLSNWIIIENCIFNCSELFFVNINNPELMITFKNCVFNCDVKIINCVIGRLIFNDTKNINSLYIEKGIGDNNRLEIDHFEFRNNPESDIKLNSLFSFDNCKFENFLFDNIKQTNGKFLFKKNSLGNEISKHNMLSFTNNTFFNTNFSDNIFSSRASFLKSIFTYENDTIVNQFYRITRFTNNTFSKIEFSEVNFTNSCIFHLCDFNKTTWFENCKNITNSSLHFTSCKFDGYTLFDHSELNNLDIIHSIFEKKVSFYGLKVNNIRLHQLTFNKAAYFDEIKINNIINNTFLKEISKHSIIEYKHTLRIIKQELQRTENKIDFGKFRNYELATHYKELNWRNDFKDKFILYATKCTTGFNQSWKQALTFTLIAAFLFYSLFFISEDIGKFEDFNLNNFIIGYFRFLLVTDFYDPLSEGRTYIVNDGWNHIVSWFIFILGKIVIAFGIYEMIQAFRKFKA